MQNQHYTTIRGSGLPARVVSLSEGTFQISASYCKFHLNAMLDEFEVGLVKDSIGPEIFEAHSVKTLNLRKLKRTRDQIMPEFLAALEHRMAIIRAPAPAASVNTPLVRVKSINDLSLVDDHYFERHQLLSSMAARCESHNNAEIHALRQRFSVLSGKAPFTNEELPLGPAVLCECLQAALAPVDLDDEHFSALLGIFERRFMGNYGKLLSDCNAYLAGKGVLMHLNYTPYRNPELRHKKSAIAKTGTAATITSPALSEPPADGTAPVGPGPVASNRGFTSSPEPERPNGGVPAGGYRFEDFRELLSNKQKMLRDMDGLPDISGGSSQISGHSVSASKHDIHGIIGDLQRTANSQQDEPVTVQAIKEQIQNRLMNLSTGDRQLTLTAEDSDAIDMVGLLMDSALKNFKPNSATSQLMGMLQAPLVRVVLDDKSFFENHVHPARRMLETLAETGLNWLDVADRDEKLYSNVYGIVSNMSTNFDGDSQTLLNAYEETNRLLQTLIRKAEAIERRQVEIAKGRDRLSIARIHAEETMDDLLTGPEVRNFTRSILQSAWTDVLVLTELRNGADSQNWRQLKDAAESIILSDRNAEPGSLPVIGADLAKLVPEALQLVGYSPDEAEEVSTRLLDAGMMPDDAPNEQDKVTTAPVNTDASQRDKPVYNLDAAQTALVDRIKSLPFGTWFDFQTSEWGAPERRKMAWVSHVTHHMLFVTPRGQKAAEMRIEDLAIAMSSGNATIYEEDNRGIFQRALDSVYSSLKGILPGAGGDRS